MARRPSSASPTIYTPQPPTNPSMPIAVTPSLSASGRSTACHRPTVSTTSPICCTICASLPRCAPLLTAFRHTDHVVAILPYFCHQNFCDDFCQMMLLDTLIYPRSLFTTPAAAHATGILHRAGASRPTSSTTRRRDGACWLTSGWPSMRATNRSRAYATRTPQRGRSSCTPHTRRQHGTTATLQERLTPVTTRQPC